MFLVKSPIFRKGDIKNVNELLMKFFLFVHKVFKISTEMCGGGG